MGRLGPLHNAVRPGIVDALAGCFVTCFLQPSGSGCWWKSHQNIKNFKNVDGLPTSAS